MLCHFEKILATVCGEIITKHLSNKRLILEYTNNKERYNSVGQCAKDLDRCHYGI